MPKALDEAERLIAGGVTDVAALEKAVSDFIASEALAKPEVVTLRDPETLHELTEIGEKPVLLLLFIRFGSTKLLDNRVLAQKLQNLQRWHEHECTGSKAAPEAPAASRH